jgi:hypothetical protein
MMYNAYCNGYSIASETEIWHGVKLGVPQLIKGKNKKKTGKKLDVKCQCANHGPHYSIM